MVVFAHLGSSFSPLLRLKVPPGSPSGTVPIISCITSPTNRKTGSFANLVIFFHFLPLKVFWCLFLRFLTPLYAHMGAQGLHMDPIPEFDELPRQPTKEHSLSANLVHFFLFSPFLSFFWHVFWLFLTPLCA